MGTTFGTGPPPGNGVTACDHSPESLALLRCLVMRLRRASVGGTESARRRGTTDDGADEQRVGQVESHSEPQVSTTARPCV